MIPEVGQQLGPYEILGELSSRGTAKVLRGWDRRLQREVAIKLIRRGAEQPEVRERFLREARMASGLVHPNLCTVFELGGDLGGLEGELFLVMDLLQGVSLKERIAGGALPWQEVVQYGRELAGALALAHSRGVLHRDLRPAKIFLVALPDGGWQAKLLGLGMAAQGTVGYLSPEQMRGELLDGRSDLFSLGAVLFEMATGRALSPGGERAELLGLESGAPRDLELILRRLLERQPECRFQSAEELERALAALSAEHTEGWSPRSSAAEVVARDPATRPTYPPRRLEAPRVMAVWAEEDEVFQVPARAAVHPELKSTLESLPAGALVAVKTGVAAKRPVITAREWPELETKFPELETGFLDLEGEIDDEEAIAAGKTEWRRWGWLAAALLMAALVGAIVARDRGWLVWAAPRNRNQNQTQGRVLLPMPLRGEGGKGLGRAVSVGLAIDPAQPQVVALRRAGEDKAR